MYAGIFCRTANAPPSAHAQGEALLAGLDPFAQADKSGWAEEGSLLLAAALRCNTPESKLENPVFRCPESGLLIACWARLDNRTELFTLLDTPMPERNGTSDQQLLLAAYVRFGENCTSRLAGDFSFVIFDPVRQSIFAARDPLGARPFYYHLSDRVFVFATTAAVFHQLKNMHLAADTTWMARYLTGVSMSHTATGLAGGLKLAAGHWLRVEREKDTLRRYFTFRDDAPFATTRHAQWVEDYRTALEEAHRCRLRSAYSVASETSGGLDSSTVTAYAAKLFEQPLSRLHTFGFACCELEPRFILETSHCWGIHQNHIFTFAGQTETGAKEVERTLKVLGYPEEHDLGSNHIPFYELCRRFGIRTLLSGFGGDEAVTSPAAHLRLEMRLYRSLRGLWNAVPGNCLTRTLRMLNDLRSLRTRPEFNARMLQTFAARWSYNLVREDLAEALDLKGDYLEQARYDAPYQTVNEFILGNRINAPFVPTRLENCSLVAASYGVDYRWPLLDPRLIQQYLSTPAIEKAKGSVGRYLHRRAVNGLVPASVLWKSKDMGMPRHRKERSLDENRKDLTIRRAHEQVGNLHHRLSALIDVNKLQRQIGLARENGTDQFWFQFRRNVRHLEWLNRWLHTLG